MNSRRRARRPSTRSTPNSILADATAFDAKEAEIKDIDAQISRAQRAHALNATLARPVGATVGADNSDAANARGGEQLYGAPTVSSLVRELRATAMREQSAPDFNTALSIARRRLDFQPAASTHFRTLGEQLQAIARHYLQRETDPRLVKAPTDFTRAPTGAAEMDPTGGGFLVQTDFAGTIFMLAHDMGEIFQPREQDPDQRQRQRHENPAAWTKPAAPPARAGAACRSNWVGGRRRRRRTQAEIPPDRIRSEEADVA